MTPPRLTARATAVVLAALLLCFCGLLGAAPASAHDELVSADPAADATLDALPAQLIMTFSGEIAPDAGASEVQVTDAAGAQLAQGDPVVQSNVVTQTLTGQASGIVNVLWKVVSSDGHPISGEYSFTVAGAPSPTPTPTPTSTATPTPSATPTEAPTSSPTETSAPVPVDSGDAALPWIIGGLLLFAAVAGAVIYLLVSRARRQKALAQARPSGSAPPAER